MLLSLSVQNKDYHFRQNPNATPLAGQNARIIYRVFSLTQLSQLGSEIGFFGGDTAANAL